MTTLLILLILFGLVGYGLKEYFQLKLGRPDSSPAPVIDELTEFLGQYGATGRFMDMGSGWGTLVLQLAKRMPEWQIDGVEASPTPWFISNIRSIGKGYNNFRFFIGRMETQIVQRYDILYFNQSKRQLNAMLPRIMRVLESDAFIITYPNPIPRLPDPHIIQTPRNEKIYLYPGLDALSFLNPPESEPAIAEPVAEPNQEIPPAVPTEPTEDNLFEHLPDDGLPPEIPPQPDDFPPTDLPTDQPAPPADDVPPPVDEADAQNRRQFETD